MTSVYRLSIHLFPTESRRENFIVGIALEQIAHNPELIQNESAYVVMRNLSDSLWEKYPEGLGSRGFNAYDQTYVDYLIATAVYQIQQGEIHMRTIFSSNATYSTGRRIELLDVVFS